MFLNPTDPLNPTKFPSALRIPDVITVDPQTGDRGEWAFTDRERIGDMYAVCCLDRDHATCVFKVGPFTPLHIKPPQSTNPRSAA